MSAEVKKSLGQAIDELIGALTPLDKTTRLSAVRAVCDHLQIDGLVLASNPASNPIVPREPRDSIVDITPRLIDIRSLKNQKSPASAIEMACLVGYFLQELAAPDERKVSIDAKDIEKYFKQGGFPLPKAKAQLLVDAKKAGYFDQAGHGTYKLNAVGYNLVAHSLPRGTKKQT